MFSKVFAAAALAVVSAADVPLFSSNDDYDEINLNIRMLSNHSSTVHTVSAKAKISGSFPAGTTAATLDASTPFKLGFCNTVKGHFTSADTCLVSAVTDASRRARALTVSLTLEVAYSLTFPTLAASDAAKTVIDDTSATSAFAQYLTSNLAANVAAQDASMTITGATASSSGSTGGGSGGAGGAAAPSPSPSSNAAKVAMSGLAAVFALMAASM